VQSAASHGGRCAIAPEFAEDDGAKAEQRTDRKIDAARENHRRHDQREQSDFRAQAQDLKEIAGRGEVLRGAGKDEQLDQQHRGEQRFKTQQPGFPRGHQRASFRVRQPSAATASKMIAP
jgi:hypothetical protein